MAWFLIEILQLQQIERAMDLKVKLKALVRYFVNSVKKVKKEDNKYSRMRPAEVQIQPMPKFTI